MHNNIHYTHAHRQRKMRIHSTTVILYCLAISVGFLMLGTMRASSSLRAQSLYNNQANASPTLSILSRRLDECAQKLDQQTLSTAANNSSPTAAICTIVKDSLFYIDEWVDYHLALGFETIYIYDNSNEFELKEWNQLRSNSRIQVQHHPGVKKQIPANDDCVLNIQDAKHNNDAFHQKNTQKASTMEFQYHEWIGILDIDEFIVLKQQPQLPEEPSTSGSTNDNSLIVDFLERTVPVDRAGLSLNWQLFYFDSQREDTLKYDPRPVTQRFQQRLVQSPHDKNVKTIARTDMIKKTNVHNHFYKYNAQSVDTSGIRPVFPYGIHAGGPTNLAAIYHYRTKSLEEYQSKCHRGSALAGPNDPASHKGIDANRRQLENDTPKHPTSWSSCWPRQEIIDLFQQEINSGGGTVFDNRAWEFLKTHVPAYRRYGQ